MPPGVRRQEIGHAEVGLLAVHRAAPLAAEAAALTDAALPHRSRRSCRDRARTPCPTSAAAPAGRVRSRWPATARPRSRSRGRAWPGRPGCPGSAAGSPASSCRSASSGAPTSRRRSAGPSRPRRRSSAAADRRSRCRWRRRPRRAWHRRSAPTRCRRRPGPDIWMPCGVLAARLRRVHRVGLPQHRAGVGVERHQAAAERAARILAGAALAFLVQPLHRHEDAAVVRRSARR